MRISDWSSDVCSSDLKLAVLSYGVAVGHTGDVVGNGPRLRHFVVAPIVVVKQTGLLQKSGEQLAHYRQRLGCHPHDLVMAVKEIVRASCRERVCHFVSISVVDVLFKNKLIALPTRSQL